VVTGAAGGIGRAVAVALAKRGANLAVADVNATGVEETAELVRREGREATAHVVDVSDKEQMRAFTEAVIEAHGAAHVLVNNAGVTVASSFSSHTLEDFEWLMGINFWGVIYGCHFFLPHLVVQPEAHIVNISSIFGIVGVPHQSSYCASKFGVRGFTESLAAELRGSSVGVTVVHPGGVNTNIVRDARGEDFGPGRTRKAVADFFATKTMSCEKAAEHIVRGIEKNRQRVLFTPESHVLDALKRLAPSVTQRVLARGDLVKL
jgi:NAD(P)-dependent dehydrogenase (short-subunit alcohol dehydrogenase family)